MGRSLKKGPFADASLLKKVKEQEGSEKKTVIKLGEFVPTRTFHGHASDDKKTGK